MVTPNNPYVTDSAFQRPNCFLFLWPRLPSNLHRAFLVYTNSGQFIFIYLFMRMSIGRIQKQRAVCFFLLKLEPICVTSMAQWRTVLDCAMKGTCLFEITWELRKSHFPWDKRWISVRKSCCNGHWYFLPSLLIWFFDKLFHPEILAAYVMLLLSCSLDLLRKMKTEFVLLYWVTSSSCIIQALEKNRD